VDYTKDAKFQKRRVATDDLLEALALPGARCPDAVKVVMRVAGWNNLQGHARALVPLAIWFAFHHPQLCSDIRDATSLRKEMTSASTEARDAVWQMVQATLKSDLATLGGDIVATGLQTNSPSTVKKILKTYCSDRYGGSHGKGGAGDTVFKRTLKILSHTLVL
jgi:hypothetical protein